MELLRALAALVEATDSAQHGLAAATGLPAPPDAAAHTDLFRLQLPPYASIYLGHDGMLGGEARDGIAGFWRALGNTPPAEPDHLTTLLAAHASLVEHDAGGATGQERWRTARHAFFWEHLASWLPPYLGRVGEVGRLFHRAWATVLLDVLDEEAETLGPPVSLPAALAVAPPVDGSTSGPALLEALLAPARSGVLLTRSDLAAAARSLGLGVRVGERAFVARWLLQQDPSGMLDWLAGEADRQARLMAMGPASLRPVSEHWRTRATAMARVLTDAAREIPAPPQEACHA
jgi:TorA maturation chaperone TorD